MSVEFRSKSYRIASHGIAETTLSGRRLAAMITGGAAALALVLATAIPARTEPNDLTTALIAALVVGAIAHELNDKDKPAPEPAESNRVPSVCAISIDGAERSVTLFPESCLRKGLRLSPAALLREQRHHLRQARPGLFGPPPTRCNGRRLHRYSRISTRTPIISILTRCAG